MIEFPQSNKINPYFQFTTIRQKRLYTRLQLIGPGPASFYYDACRLMSLEPSLMSTTHIVSHLLREIESALRKVLVAASGEKINSKSQSNHKDSIQLVLNFLDLPASHPAAIFWLNLPDGNYGLQARAHRDALAYRPVNTEFVDFWGKMENVFDTVLQRFEEKYLSAHKLIDQLLTIDNPTEEDLKKLRNDIPNSPSALRVFFTNANEVWLELLKPHFFNLPPRIDPVENDFTPWPESQFLVRSTKSNPETVLEIIMQLPDTDNPYVLDDLCDIALALPIELTLTLLPRVKSWLVSKYQRMLPIKIAQLIQRLTENHKTEEALELSRELLAILPEPQESPYGSQNISSKYQAYVYNELLEEYVFGLAERVPLDFVLLLSNLINDAISSLSKEDDMTFASDPSQWWPIIPQDKWVNNIQDSLISALYRTLMTAINKDPNNLIAIIQILENYSWAIFRRFALYLLALHPKVSQSTNARYLKNQDFFHDFPSEYYLLLEKAFNQLQSSEQAEILDWFEDLQDINPDHRQLHWLTAVKDDLVGIWKSRYDQLIQSLGEPSKFIYHSPIEAYTYWGDGSPKTTDELLNMNTDEIFEYLKTWQPSNELEMLSKRGLGSQLKELVNNSPNKLAVEAGKFITISPIYINFFLSGLGDACSNKKKFLWPAVLELCREITSLLTENFSLDILEDWSWTKAEIADLLRKGFETDSIDFVHRDLTWSILYALIKQTPNPEDEYRGIDRNMSPLELSYNTFRGRTLHAIMQYLFWVQNHLRKLSDPSIKFKMSSEMAPEVILVLDDHILNKSLAVKAVFGRYIPWLDLLDSEWLAKKLKDIFVDDDVVWSAAWTTYITTCRPFDHNLSLLKNEYLRAVSTISIHYSESKIRKDNQYLEHLIGHIMAFYMRGLLEIDELGGVLQLFYQGASDEMCAYAMQHLGQSLEYYPEPISEETVRRLERLWQYRLEQIRVTPQPHQHELHAFSWWFVSGKLDPEWSIEQLKQVLSLSADSKIVLADDIIAQLKMLADKMPQDVVECLDYIIDHTRELWKIDIWQTDIRAILIASLKSSNLFAQQKSSAFINKLAARGYLAFRDLLKP